MRIFISYAREDEDFAKRIFKYLADIEEIQPWLDRERLQPGITWEEAILHAIAESQMFIFLVSLASVSKEGFLKKEISAALHAQEQKPHGDIFIVPVRIDGTPLANDFARFQAIDLHTHPDEGLAELRSTILKKLTNSLEKAFSKTHRHLTPASMAQWEREYGNYVASFSPTTVIRFLAKQFDDWREQLGALQMMIETREMGELMATYVMRLREIGSSSVGYIDTMWLATGLFLHYIKRIPIHLSGMMMRDAFEGWHRTCRSNFGNTFTPALVLADVLKHYLTHPVPRDESDHFIASRALQVLVKYDVMFCEVVIFYARRAADTDLLLGIVPLLEHHYRDIPLLKDVPLPLQTLSNTFAIDKNGWQSMEQITNFDDGTRKARLHAMLLRIGEYLTYGSDLEASRFGVELQRIATELLKDDGWGRMVAAISLLTPAGRRQFFDCLERMDEDGVASLLNVEHISAECLIEQWIHPFCAYYLPGQTRVFYPVLDESAFRQPIVDEIGFMR